MPPDMTRGRSRGLRQPRRAMAAPQRLHARAVVSDLYITDGDQIDWLYCRHRIFSYTFEMYPTETPTVWGDHYPPDERIAAQTARNRSAILYLIDQADCPYAASTQAVAAVNDCGPLYDDFEIDRGWHARPVRHRHRDDRDLDRAAARGDDRHRAASSWARSPPGSGPWSPARAAGAIAERQRPRRRPTTILTGRSR